MWQLRGEEVNNPESIEHGLQENDVECSSMFTGIVETTATILEKTSSGFTIERPLSFDDVQICSSICVSGVCLSIVELTPSSMRFDVVPETWAKTTLEERTKGDRVNLERAMKVGDRLDGHVVQGHVEGVGIVKSVKRKEKSLLITFHFPLFTLPFIVPKGSVTIDGVSLTIMEIDGNRVTIVLIPHTLKHTTLGVLTTGDQVNIETDVTVRTALTAASSERPSATPRGAARRLHPGSRG